MIEEFMFGVLPYLALGLFIAVPIFRAFSGGLRWTSRGDYQWTTRASGFFGKRKVGLSSMALHWGILILLISHILGLIGSLWGPVILVEVFHWLGLVGGIMFLYGLIAALAWRTLNPDLRSVSRAEDYIILVWLIVLTVIPLYQVVVVQTFGLSLVVGPWVKSVFMFEPDISYLSALTLLTKLHLSLSLLFFAYVPFTKMVHMWSFPFEYLFRPLISMRKLPRFIK